MYPEWTVERRGYLERVFRAPMYPCVVARMKMCPRGIFVSSAVRFISAANPHLLLFHLRQRDDMQHRKVQSHQ